jgi:hypothetical protein
MDGSEAVGGKDGKEFFLSLHESSHSTLNNTMLRKRRHGIEGPSPDEPTDTSIKPSWRMSSTDGST